MIFARWLTFAGEPASKLIFFHLRLLGSDLAHTIGGVAKTIREF
jgi:hypothetical protein